jgi:hypothetical protein
MEILSIADLRQLTGQPDHVLNHAIRRFGPEPRGRVGITRVWSSDDLPEIQAALAKTARRSTIAERRDTDVVPPDDLTDRLLVTVDQNATPGDVPPRKPERRDT